MAQNLYFLANLSSIILLSRIIDCVQNIQLDLYSVLALGVALVIGLWANQIQFLSFGVCVTDHEEGKRQRGLGYSMGRVVFHMGMCL